MARKLENWLRTYLAYTQPLEAPDTFHFWTGVSTIAGALRRRVWLDMGLFQWTPNFYIILVAPPGIVSKSTTLAVGMRFLKEIEDVHFGPDAVTWQALTQSLAAARVDFPHEGAFWPMSAITIAASEFGTFLNPHDREMVDVLVDLWDGRLGSWEKRTKTSGSDKIINPWINLAACTTPGWIAGNFPEYLIGGGFTSRCVFVFADKKRRLVPYPVYELPPEFTQMQEDLLHDLNEISHLTGAFTLSPEAREFGVAWYSEHYDNINKQLNTNQFAGYLARKQTHIHKLAMVLSAADSDSLIIEETHLRHAEAITTALEADMPRVFSNIGQQGNARHTSAVIDIVRAYGKIGKRELFRIAASKMSIEEFSSAMEAAAFTGYVRLIQNGSEMTYVYVPDNAPEEPARKDAYDLGTGSG